VADRPSRRTLLGLIAVLLIALLAVLLWRGQWIVAPDEGRVASVDPGCDLHAEACYAELPDGGELRLAIRPRPIRMRERLELEVTVSGVEPERVQVDFQGVEMFMGYNRPELEPVNARVFQGEAVLPLCLTDEMTWEAQVLLDTAEGRTSAPFRFATQRDDAAEP